MRRRLGRQKIFTIGKHGSPWTVEQARNRASEILYDAGKGGDPQSVKQQRRHALTVSELIELYLREGSIDKPNKRARSWSNDRLHLRHHVAALIGPMKAHAVTSADVAKLQADVAAGKTAGETKTKKRGVARVRGGQRAAAVTVVCLQAMYNWAIKRKLVPENPAKGVERFKSEPFERYLTMEELNRLLTTLVQMQDDGELDARLASAFRLLLLTGARKSEISDLRWEEIDLERAFITLNALRSKTGRKRITLSATALAELRDLSPQKDGYVFPAKRGEGPTRALQDAWEAIRIEAGIENVRIHDLRHTFASLAAAGGQSLYLIGKALGHAQSRTTKRYAHLVAEPIWRVGDIVAAKIAASRQGDGKASANASSGDSNGSAS
ncbi:MAG: tyrosine-type recombinase/integrase [Caulobacteraceae bacterium]